MDREEQGRPGGFCYGGVAGMGGGWFDRGTPYSGKLGEETSGGEEWGREMVFINGLMERFPFFWVGLFWSWAGGVILLGEGFRGQNKALFRPVFRPKYVV